MTGLSAELMHALLLALLFSALLLVPSFCLGLVCGAFQGLTSIQDQVLTFVPKVLVGSVVLYFASGWMLSEMQDFMSDLLRLAEAPGAEE